MGEITSRRRWPPDADSWPAQSITNGIGAGFITYSFIKLVAGRAGEVHWMMWLASAAFVIYFALPWLKGAFGF